MSPLGSITKLVVRLAFLLLAFMTLFSPASYGQTLVDASGLFASVVYIVADAQIVGTANQRQQFYGSGVIVSPEGYVLTAAHILPDVIDHDTYTDVQLTGVVGSKFSYPIKLEKTGLINKEADVVLLKFPSIPNVNLKPAEVPADLNVPVDSAVTIVGFPKALDTNITRGRITSINGPQGTWITDAKILEGSSGSPVFNVFGQLIGIATSGIQSPGNPNPLGLNLIVPVSIARSLTAGIAWQISTNASRAECKSTPISLSGDKANFPTSASTPVNRATVASELSGTLATSYPWVILDGATVRLSDSPANVYRFCRLELKGGSRIVIGEKQVFILSNYVGVNNGRVIGIDASAPTDATPDSVPGTGQMGRAGKAGRSSGSVLLATVLRFDGTLPFELDGEHGGTGGTGGPEPLVLPGLREQAARIRF
jgi:hypothetical protein